MKHFLKFSQKIHPYLMLAGISLLILPLATLWAQTKDPRDPFETINRQIFLFNYDVDRLIYRPVAHCYVKTVHPHAQKAITNFFNHLEEIPSLINDILQLDGYHLVINTWRFMINSTLGLLGTRDVASQWGLPPYKNDFGLTLYKWGFRNTPYIQIAFIGPSTWHDAIGMILDYPLKPLSYVGGGLAACGTTALRHIPKRAELLPANRLIDQAIDPYIFVRDAYFQKRQADVKKMGKPPIHKSE